ncbi:MAG TPA: regulatory iron-sulfur-containing complex subunit RicT [Patescibacteria group bacterium]|nr:regulatory iron-sulfur-containing complex subunit RicT [Patescibacteria group bacterium]
MRLAKVKFASWDKAYSFKFSPEMNLGSNDYVIVDTKVGREMGRVVDFEELTENEVKELPEDPKSIIRQATKEDIDKALGQEKLKKQAFRDCRQLIKKHDLPIKLVDVYFTFDNNRITFAFIADGRVDFRSLLRDLIKKYHKNIRLQQLGIRDEVRINGDIGCCGRPLCCRGFYKDLGNVTSDLADLQQVAHRGSERLSGVCGRLKCCLTYEKDLYNEMAEGLPMVGEKIKTPHGRGEVIGWHVLKRTVDVLLEDKETVMEVPIKK